MSNRDRIDELAQIDLTPVKHQVWDDGKPISPVFDNYFLARAFVVEKGYGHLDGRWLVRDKASVTILDEHRLREMQDDELFQAL